MTTVVDIVNRALQTIGTRTTVTALELANQSTNEAIQAMLILETVRDDLLRMAPWNCANITKNLTYITSLPGTPENSTSGTEQWQAGQPQPPWLYEYQYPVDCLRPVRVIPQFPTGFAGGVPITTAVTGGGVPYWAGPPVRYAVAVDQFYPVTAAAVVFGGTGYAVGDIITLPYGPTSAVPIGAPVKLRVATAPAGVLATVTVVNQISGEATPLGGSYFTPQTGTIAQDTTTGVGTGATFTLTFGDQTDQRVVLTNQESATLSYIRQVTNPNVMDPQFQTAWYSILGASLCIPLSGDKTLATQAIQRANNAIMEARKSDGNEGLTVNDHTPDWIRARGVNYNNNAYGQAFDWGPTWPNFI